MRYMLLIYKDEKVWDEMSAQEKGTIFQQAVDFSEGLRKSGLYQAGEPLEPTSTATTVRMKNGTKCTACISSQSESIVGSRRCASSGEWPLPGKCFGHADSPALAMPRRRATP